VGASLPTLLTSKRGLVARPEPAFAAPQKKDPPASLPAGLRRNDHTALALAVAAAAFLVERLD
jgi:hypothetical protein